MPGIAAGSRSSTRAPCAARAARNSAASPGSWLTSSTAGVPATRVMAAPLLFSTWLSSADWTSTR